LGGWEEGDGQLKGDNEAFGNTGECSFSFLKV